MTDNFIQLKEDNILRLEIIDKEGKSTGNHLEFDLDDIEKPLIYQKMTQISKRNKDILRNEFVIIEKRQDVKGKKLFSKNEEDKIRALQKYFRDEAENLNMFLGENGVQKLLCGRKLGWTTLGEISEIINKQIAPHLDKQKVNIEQRIKELYSNGNEKDKEVLK